VLETAGFTDKVSVAGVLPLDGATVRKLPPVLGTKETVNGTLAPVVAPFTCRVVEPGIDIEPASTLNEALLLESVMADVAEVTSSVTGI
jgi:hypothetical protein